MARDRTGGVQSGKRHDGVMPAPPARGRGAYLHAACRIPSCLRGPFVAKLIVRQVGKTESGRQIGGSSWARGAGRGQPVPRESIDVDSHRMTAPMQV